MSEHRIQNEIRNALAGRGLFFRANVGKGWTGSSVTRVSRSGMVYAEAGAVVLAAARPFDTGLPAGFSDVFGLVPVTVGPQHVGQTLALFAAIECKAPAGRVSPGQRAFLEAVTREGGRAGVARSVDDALQIVGLTW